MSKALNKLFWHDGNLVDLSFSANGKAKSSLSITVLLYKDDQAPSRETYFVACNDVSKFCCTLDIAELRDNFGAGNISNAYLKNDILWVYFSDGLLEVSAKKYRVEKR